MATLNVNDVAEIELWVRVKNVLTAPTAGISIKVQSPTQKTAGTWTTYTVGANLLNPSTGYFKALIACTEAGQWRFIWTTPGPTAQGAETGFFDVEANPF